MCAWSLIENSNNFLYVCFPFFQFLATVKEGITGVIVNLTIRDQDDPATGAWRAVYTIINGNAGQSFEIHTNPQNNEGMLSVVKVRTVCCYTVLLLVGPLIGFTAQENAQQG